MENYTTQEGLKPPFNFLQMLNDGKMLKEGTIYFEKPLNSLAEEEQAFHKGIIKEAREEGEDGFIRTRKQVQKLLQELVYYIFDEYEIPVKKGLDIGSGSQGYFVETLMKPFLGSNKTHWKQMELNRSYVEKNKKLHPLSQIIEGSYHRLTEVLKGETFDTITGLSCLDATHFIAHAITEIRNSLNSGGYFLHIQDVGPGVGCIARERIRRGKSLQCEVQVKKNQPQDPCGVKIENEFIPLIEVFRKNFLYEIAKVEGLELVLDKWITVSAPSDLIVQGMKAGKIYYSNDILTVSHPVNTASALVTLLKKQ